MEIVCCRGSIEVNVLITDKILLSNWVYNCFVAGQLDKLVEDENVDMKTLERMVKVGLWYIQEDPALRPPMKNVILTLRGDSGYSGPSISSYFSLLIYLPAISIIFIFV